MTRDAIHAALIGLVFLAVSPAHAVEPDEMLPDPALEARARAISRDVRCPVCRNESIDDSNAELARDLRLIVRERLAAGESDAEVKRFLIDRYGEFILLTPVFNRGNLALWLAGPAALIFGAAAAAVYLRGRRRASKTVRLTPEEKAEVERLLRE